MGVWAAYLAPHFKKVYTFEPDRENHACLVKNVGQIDNIEIHNAGLGNTNTTASVYNDGRNCGANYLVDGDDASIITIDSLNLTACDLIVLDIEGYEEFAFQGALETIKKFHPVLMYEDKDLSVKYTGHKKGYIEEWMVEYGYEVKERIHRDVVLA